MTDTGSQVPSASLLPLALQYLVAGRFLALQLQIPVAGNLYHHAIEFFLKAALSSSIPEKRLASREFGHNLENLWHEFKDRYRNASAEFDGTVHLLNKFEKIRYPEAKFGAGPKLHLAIFRQADGKSMGAPGSYAFVLEDMDSLVRHIVKYASLEFMLQNDIGFLPDMSKRVLLEKNKHPLVAGPI